VEHPWGQRFRELYDEELRLVRSENPAPLTIEEVPQSHTLPSFAPAQDHSEEFYRWKDRYVENQRQSKMVSVRIPVFLGYLMNDHAIQLAKFLAPFGDHVVRASFGQNLRLRNIPKSYLANVFHLAREISGLSSGPRIVSDSIACTGADTCKLDICLSKGALTAAAERLKISTLDLDRIGDFRLNLSGCPNTCGQHMIADLGFYGNVGRNGQDMFPACRVVAGAEIGAGKARLARQIDRVRARDLPEFVHEVLKLWIVKKTHHTSFAAYVDGEGAQDLRSIAGRFRQIPAYRENKSYYFDWGAKESFSLVGKGVGECSAGLFDLIEVDLNGAKQLREEFRAGDYQGENPLYTISLRSARALPITRGIEAPTDAAVFENFARHFVQAGLIDSRFESVIERAKHKDTEGLNQLEEEVFALLQAVEALYRNMDNSLRFPEKAKSTA
jgi:sulfite reductase (ferredoxin)